jgi:hypothetical protein
MYAYTYGSSHRRHLFSLACTLPSSSSRNPERGSVLFRVFLQCFSSLATTCFQIARRGINNISRLVVLAFEAMPSLVQLATNLTTYFLRLLNKLLICTDGELSVHCRKGAPPRSPSCVAYNNRQRSIYQSSSHHRRASPSLSLLIISYCCQCSQCTCKCSTRMSK